MKRASREVTFCQKTLAVPSIDEIEKQAVLKYFSIKIYEKGIATTKL